MPYSKTYSIVALGIFATLVAAVSLAAAQDLVVIATSDFTSGSLASLRVGADSASVNLINTHGDNAVRSYSGMVYVINRLGADNILVLDPKNLRRPVKQFSVGNGANPQDIAFASATKAYVPRYDRPGLLVVNPATGDSLKAIDLSAFADADGAPEMAAAFVVGKRVYVTCQRLDRKARFAPTDKSVIAVIDAEADTVIDLDPKTAGVQGIDLALKNPGSAVLRNGRIYLSCVGSYSDFKDGGIEVVDTAQNRSLGAGITEEVLGGNVGPLAVASDSAGFVVVSDASFANSIKRFDLSARTASGPLTGHSGGFTPDIQVSGGLLYVADQGSFTDPKSAGLLIYNPVTRVKSKGPISTGLPPNGIAFVTVLAADFDGSGAVDFEDFFAFAAAFGKKQGDAGFDAKYDLSKNGVVDFDDFFAFVDQFGYRR
ncbi:MAG: hypothetical protein A3F84_26790 [Candidatus Handelsmanbacteria bacterium RIFCSPLOWO2_12_FULL_64_10]|uniref:EF-hand domain-containing protein n=1 Tax=Handelsmanbacteria sp. (strain RIFCSPLOWO2_12_FULL_64_10) TaxID=1817868 RepID=A0A1F6CIQ0_HANXR|nr:MAG: hypothetical protein A3F84_26790 [Candidatus Handelsmanbacteria bacterium RIFCSPLOWO2_12_FULL_64_10]